ncbi:hypothetical protein BJ508DRAFT_128768 [Ascobolus immersus RN42]|uniref:Uncharacterized protein n=1 Tax=Ascobolus immersus RN42 TaxID=1160509 RepID=A0A3N4IFB0_ASCIM|nr:hypothetical protein BJ508DRAFT_128768 [Ascobolus immersus RN42]
MSKWNPMNGRSLPPPLVCFLVCLLSPTFTPSLSNPLLPHESYTAFVSLFFFFSVSIFDSTIPYIVLFCSGFTKYLLCLVFFRFFFILSTIL